MSRAQISLSHLRYFYAVARTQSIREAANQLHVVQSAISRQIKNLEQDIGVPLFDRHARGVRLTEAGRILADYAHQLFLGLDYAQSKIDELRALHRGTVRLCTVEGAVTELVPAVASAFQRDFPGLKLVLIVRGTLGVVDTVLADDADVGIAFHTPKHPNLRFLASKPQPLNAVLRADHPLAASRKLRIGDLQDQRIALPDSSFGIRQLVDEIQRRNRTSLQPVFETNSIASLANFARQGLGISFLPYFAVKSQVDDGTVVAIPLDDPPARRPNIDIIAHAGRRLPFAAEEFVRRLRTALKELR